LDTEETFTSYLKQVAQYACALVEKEFTYGAAVESYRNIVDSLRVRRHNEDS